MALRCLYLGRKMGVPALRQLATTPRRLASSSSQSSHQGGHNNGARVAADAWNWKPLPHVDVDVAKQMAEFKAACEAVRKAIEEDRRNTRFLIGSILIGVGMALLTMWHSACTETQRTMYLRSKYA